MMSEIFSNLLANIDEHSNSDDSHNLKTFLIPDEIKLKNWENHALLHLEQVHLLNELVELLEINNLYVKNGKMEGLHVKEHIESPDKFEELRREYFWSDDYLKYKAKCPNMDNEKYKINEKNIIIKLNKLISITIT
jgi:hypothetical protein